MAEVYQSTRDALIEVVAAALGDKTHRQLPWYARTEQKREVGLTGAELDAALASWAVQFPDRVN